MTPKSDLELVKACARMMKLDVYVDAYGDLCLGSEDHDGDNYHYWPLTDAAQNDALDEVFLAHGYYEQKAYGFKYWKACAGVHESFYQKLADMTKAENRYRARVECCAKLEEGHE